MNRFLIPTSEKLPYGLLPLCKLINCKISGLGWLMGQLVLDDLCSHYDQFKPAEEQPIDDETRSRAVAIAKVARSIASDFEWQAVHDRVDILDKRLKGRYGPITNHQFGVELRVLRETIDNGLKNQFIYRYPTEKAKVLRVWKDEWAVVIEFFPDARQDVLSAIDLWAMGHSTASVFHFMRVLEHGLDALASEVGCQFDIQNWYNIIGEIEKAIRKETSTLPRGVARNARLQFLSEAAKEFSYFKDGWRNYVSHNKASYDEHQAQSVMVHTRQFMTTLATNLSAECYPSPF